MILMRDDEVFMIREGSDDNVDDRELFEALEMCIDDELSSIMEGSDDDDDNRELLEALEKFVDDEVGVGLDEDHYDR